MRRRMRIGSREGGASRLHLALAVGDKVAMSLDAWRCVPSCYQASFLRSMVL